MITCLGNVESHATSYVLSPGQYEIRIHCSDQTGCVVPIEISSPATITFAVPVEKIIDIKEIK